MPQTGVIAKRVAVLQLTGLIAKVETVAVLTSPWVSLGHVRGNKPVPSCSSVANPRGWSCVPCESRPVTTDGASTVSVTIAFVLALGASQVPYGKSFNHILR